MPVSSRAFLGAFVVTTTVLAVAAGSATDRVDDSACAPAACRARASVLKFGGSVLRDDASYASAARFLQARLARHAEERLIVIVSAQYGTTDALLAEARTIANQPSAPALDLLWSTGELRSVAILALHLQRIGVGAVPFNVHQAGLVACLEPSREGDEWAGTSVRPMRLLAALAHTRVVIVPGFFGIGGGDAIVSLGRRGSDLTVVLLAAAIEADACELIKDVPGYFTADPHTRAKARPIHDLTFDDALGMADAGCDLVQRAALAAADAASLRLVIRSMDAVAPISTVHTRSRSSHGVRHQDDSRRPAVGA
jgi:aspartate kinase